VRYQPKTSTYHTLEEQCLATGTLPSIAYGGRSCALKYKRHPQDRMILARFPPSELIGRGRRVVRAIGFDASEKRRTYAGVVKAIGLDAGEHHRLTWAKAKPGDGERKPSREAWLDEHFFCYWYPLYSDWRMDRAACERSIRDAGLPVPVKSACYFCPASKKHEIVELRLRHPELLKRALAIEANAKPNLTSVVGLGRSFAWADFLADLDDTPLFPDCST
jgi:hypothetical protein